jgi:hypothetical protein
LRKWSNDGNSALLERWDSTGLSFLIVDGNSGVITSFTFQPQHNGMKSFDRNSCLEKVKKMSTVLVNLGIFDIQEKSKLCRPLDPADGANLGGPLVDLTGTTFSPSGVLKFDGEDGICSNSVTIFQRRFLPAKEYIEIKP